MSNEDKKPEIDVLAQVSTMANLTSAIKSESLKKTILEMPDGERIYEILVAAIYQEVQGIMGKSSKDEKELSGNMQQMAAAMSKFVSIVNTFNDTKLVGVLNAIAQKLKPLGDLGQPQNLIDNGLPSGVTRSNPEAAQAGNEQNVYLGPGQRAPRNPGLGSF